MLNAVAPPVKRETVHAGGEVVSMKVPLNAREGLFPSPEGNNQYLQFAQNVRGGAVNIFVHGTEPARFRGMRVTAKVSVLKKTLEDGRRFLHINLLPVDEPRTHRLAVMSESDVILEEGFVSFKTPDPLEGKIVLAPLGSKIRKTTD